MFAIVAAIAVGVRPSAHAMVGVGVRPSAHARVATRMSDASLYEQRSGKASMEASVLAKYLDLPMPDDTLQAEYIFVDANLKMRGKCRTLTNKQAASVEVMPRWTYDGSSTGQAPGQDSEVIIVPRAAYKDPFRPNGRNLLVLCDTYDAKGNALPTNAREAAAKAFAADAGEIPWFGARARARARPQNAARPARAGAPTRNIAEAQFCWTEHVAEAQPDESRRDSSGATLDGTLRRGRALPTRARAVRSDPQVSSRSTRSSTSTRRRRSAGPRAASRGHKGPTIAPSGAATRDRTTHARRTRARRHRSRLTFRARPICAPCLTRHHRRAPTACLAARSARRTTRRAATPASRLPAPTPR